MKVGFTNGCFDLLHQGHIHFLDRCKAHCDYLIVAINTDMSVKRLKGEARPFQRLEERIQALHALCSASVDAVIPFKWNDDLALLVEALEPAVLFKGSDYRLENIVGADYVLADGGEVMIIDRLPDQSTTEIARATGRLS